jgi:glucokinase
MNVVGVDLGGTQLKSAVVGPGGELAHAATEPTRCDFPELLGRLERRIETLLEDAGAGCAGVGIAAPGIVESEFGVRRLPGKLLGLEGFPLVEHLSERLGVPVRCLNDGSAAVLAEAVHGAAAGLPDVVGFTLGTGVGSGVVIGGRPLRSAHLGAGVSLGHLTIRSDGRTCLCGNRGCAETLVSADAVAARLHEHLERGVECVWRERWAREPAAVGFPEVVEGAAGGDRLCGEILDEFRRDLGALVVCAAHAFYPSMVVIGGGAVAAADAFLPAVQAYVDRYAFVHPADRRMPVVAARLGGRAGTIGAALHLEQAVAETAVS